MAALQTIRSKGALLVGVLGLALFAFIAEEFFRSIETTSMIDKSQVGKVFGEKLSVQDFQTMVDEQCEVVKLQMSLQGQNPTLTDQQTEQIREQVWQQFVQKKMVEDECKKLGIYVTDGEMQEALREGSAGSLRMVASIFGNPQTGKFDLASLQQFLKDYDRTVQQAQQAQNAEAVEQIQLIKKLWDFSEKQLRDELLSNKYNMLFGMGFVSNPVAAKDNFDSRTVQKNAEVAALPYSTVDDKDIKVTDEELKAAYEEFKDNFYSPVPTRDVKLLDVNVVASAADRAELTKKVDDFQQQLRNSDNVADVVRTSNSEVLYSDLALSKEFFSRMPDVSAALDSMAVGSVKPTYYYAQDNTVNTFKLVGKQEAPDSILYRRIVATAATPEARKAQADSILRALNGGAAYADLAKKYGQPTDSVWLTSAQYEDFGITDENADYLNSLYGIAARKAQVVSNDQGAAVVQVLDRRKMVTKYKVAVIKCPLNFSKKTYEDELGKLNRFLAQNSTCEAIEKNAAKNGYMLADLPGYSPMQNVIPLQIGGNAAKDCARWIFNEAEKGNVSKLYECGRNNDHLVVVCVTGTYDKGYLPWDNKEVKEFLTAAVKQGKKAEKAMAAAKNVKSVADMKKLKGAVSDSLTHISFAAYPSLQSVGTPEPKLAALIAKTAAGKTSTLLQGAGAVYIAQTLSEKKTEEKFDAAAEQQQVGNTIMRRAAQSTTYYLIMHKAKMTDRRYEF